MSGETYDPVAVASGAPTFDFEAVSRGRDTDTICDDKGSYVITRKSLRTLQDEECLSDEIINCWFMLLQRRDRKLSEEDPSRRQSLYMNTGFYDFSLSSSGRPAVASKAIDLSENSGPAVASSTPPKSEARNMQRLRAEQNERRVCKINKSSIERVLRKRGVTPDQLQRLDKIFIPIHVDQNHWTLTVVFVQENRVEYFDSLSHNDPDGGKDYTSCVAKWMGQVRGTPADSWAPREPMSSPQQDNDEDCGVFVCMNADYIGMGVAHARVMDSVIPGNMSAFRSRMAHNLVQGSKHIIDSPTVAAKKKPKKTKPTKPTQPPTKATKAAKKPPTKAKASTKATKAAKKPPTTAKARKPPTKAKARKPPTKTTAKAKAQKAPAKKAKKAKETKTPAKARKKAKKKTTKSPTKRTTEKGTTTKSATTPVAQPVVITIKDNCGVITIDDSDDDEEGDRDVHIAK